MCHLEPEDPVVAKCEWCGEEENIKHESDAIWFCKTCCDYFSDGTDYDGSDF